MTASAKPIADFLEVKARFKRSVHLEKDYSSSSQNGDYIVTPTARESLRRLVEGVTNGSPYRAWTLTGPYGVGKSAFAVFLTHLFCSVDKQGKQARRQLEEADLHLYEHLRDLGMFNNGSKGFLPILTTARRTSASRCLMESIVAASSTRERKIKASVRSIACLLDQQPNNSQPWDTRQIVNVLSELSEIAKLVGYAGILLVIDELGKLFEYAARYPQKGDVFILQELAEQAARSSDCPILVVGLLHQSFEEYGQHLDIATRREWAKIQGRFEDIAFLEPSDQVIRMIAQAIQWTPDARHHIPERFLRMISSAASKTGIIPPGMRTSDFEEIVKASYPLHPTTLVALPFVFRRFAQNERSLFSYLNSLEPYGFQEFIKSRTLSADNPSFVRLGDLFEYFTKNFGAGLYRHPHAQRWLEAADILERKEELGPLHREVIKTVGVLNALGEFCYLNASEQVIAFAITDTPSASLDLQDALKFLKEQSIVTYRNFNHTYRIWEGSDVDIEERIAEGERKIRHDLNLADSVRQYLTMRPLVARRHSFETGSLRYFEVEYVDDPEMPASRLESADGDGKVIVCLTESPALAERFNELAIQVGDKESVLFAIPQLIGELRAVVRELGALRWAWDNTPELRDDRVARREMSLRIAEADQLLQRNVDGLLDPRDEPVGSECLWFHKGRCVSVRSPVEVSQLLSDVCDRTYPNAPIIRNELITRRSLSTAAAAARRNLIERMLTHHAEEALGIEGYPPERSMYESVLRVTELHYRDKDGLWGFYAPPRQNPCKLLACWNFMCETIFDRQPEPIPLDRLFSLLAAPPYGIMPGLHPVLLCAFMLAYPDETTLYREGTFIPEPSIADFEVLTRRPELFAVAGSRVVGGRLFVIQRLAKGLKVDAATVPVVRALFRMVKSLPEFAWNTHNLPESTLALREAFQKAKSPEQLLYVLLPEALGLPSFSEQKPKQNEIGQFFDRLNAGLQQWTESTTRVVYTARDMLLKACGLSPGESQWDELRHLAVTLESSVAEPQLLAFVRRVTQAGQGTSGAESVLALVSSRPPRNWTDADVDRFPNVAAAIGRSFQEAVRVAGFGLIAEAQMSQLSPKERKQADAVLSGIRKYLKRTSKTASPRVIRAVMMHIIEENQE